MLAHPGILAGHLALAAVWQLFPEETAKRPRMPVPDISASAATFSWHMETSSWLALVILPVVLLIAVCLLAPLLIGSATLRLVSVQAALGRPTRPWACLGRAARRLPAYLLCGLAVWALLLMGFMLFVIPALYLFARYLPWTYAVLLEDAGSGGLARARDLTEGYRWPIVGLVLIAGLVWLALFGGVGFTLDTLEGGPRATKIATAAWTGVYTCVEVFLETLIYLRLREIKEGTPAPEPGWRAARQPMIAAPDAGGNGGRAAMTGQALGNRPTSPWSRERSG